MRKPTLNMILVNAFTKFLLTCSCPETKKFNTLEYLSSMSLSIEAEAFSSSRNTPRKKYSGCAARCHDFHRERQRAPLEPPLRRQIRDRVRTVERFDKAKRLSDEFFFRPVACCLFTLPRACCLFRFPGVDLRGRFEVAQVDDRYGVGQTVGDVGTVAVRRKSRV